MTLIQYPYPTRIKNEGQITGVIGFNTSNGYKQQFPVYNDKDSIVLYSYFQTEFDEYWSNYGDFPLQRTSTGVYKLGLFNETSEQTNFADINGIDIIAQVEEQESVLYRIQHVQAQIITRYRDAVQKLALFYDGINRIYVSDGLNFVDFADTEAGLVVEVVLARQKNPRNSIWGTT